MGKKSHYRDSNADLNRQKKVSVNLKIEQWKLSSMRSRKKKIEGKPTELKRSVEHHKTNPVELRCAKKM